MMPRGPGPGWFADPHRRFAQRYWDGSAWTVHVADAASQQTTDPLFVPAVQPSPTAQSAAAAQTGPVLLRAASADTGPVLRPATAAPAAAPVQGAAAVDETGELMKRLETAMTEYSRLLETSGPETDDADFARRALKIGLIVRDTDAWILDAPSGRWFHYNGLRLRPLGGWNSRPSQE